MKQECNKCARNSCALARKETMVQLEKAGLMKCFKVNNFKFPFADCISEIKISNPRAEVLRWFLAWAR